MDLVSVQYLRLRALILTTGLLSSSAIILVLPVESDLREGGREGGEGEREGRERGRGGREGGEGEREGGEGEREGRERGRGGREGGRGEGETSVCE